MEVTPRDPCAGVEPVGGHIGGSSGRGVGGVGSGVGSGSGSGAGGRHDTGNTAENLKSYVPGTAANKEAKYEQSQGQGRY